MIYINIINKNPIDIDVNINVNLIVDYYFFLTFFDFKPDPLNQC